MKPKSKTKVLIICKLFDYLNILDDDQWLEVIFMNLDLYFEIIEKCRIEIVN